MWRGRDQLPLEIDRRIAERGPGLGARGANGRQQIGARRHGPHALAAAAGDGLDDQRIADARRLGGDRRRRARPRQRLRGAGHDRDAGARSAASRAAVLLPMSAIASGLGPTNVRPASAHACAKSSFSARNP